VNKVADHEQYISFMVMPPSGKRSIHFRMRKLTLYLVLAGFSFIILASALSFYLSIQTLRSLGDYQVLKQERSQQQERYERLRGQIDSIKKDVDHMLEQEQQMFDALRRPHDNQEARIQQRMRKLDDQYYAVSGRHTLSLSGLEKRFSYLTQQIVQSKGDYKELAATVQAYQRQFDRMPSAWPVYGPISSDFGWRYHPVLRRFQFHQGIDISAWRGAAIRASGDGRVVYSDWGGGYGLAVVVEHSAGYRTVYAHCSRVVVRSGDLVHRGQEIAEVGSSGMSTGPHVHYEVQFNQQPIDPKPFLNMNGGRAVHRVF